MTSASSYFEGRCCPLAHYGHSRDHRGDRPQIVYGLLCTRAGLPIAVEVFDGNTADPSTLSAQVEKVKDRFGISRLVLVGDRGMITAARIRDDLRPAGLDWITCLRAPAIQALAADDGPLQLSLFDERDLAEISAPDLFPGERLIVCRNRDLAAERARKRDELLAATERELARIEARVRRKGSRRLRGAAAIGLAVGAVLDSRKVAKHFDVAIGDGRLTWRRRIAHIARRGPARRYLCHPHQRAGRASRRRRNGSGLQRICRGSISTRHGDSQDLRLRWTAPLSGGGRRRRCAGVARMVLSLAIVAASAITSLTVLRPALIVR